MTRRTERVSDLLREEISTLIQRNLKDPRLGEGLVTVTGVRVAPDLRHATVFVSYMGDESDRDGALTALSHSASHLHGELVRALRMRHVPALIFRFDPTIEQGARIAALLNDVRPGPAEPEDA